LLLAHKDSQKRQDKRHDNTGPYAAPPAFADMSQRSQTLGAYCAVLCGLIQSEEVIFPSSTAINDTAPRITI